MTVNLILGDCVEAMRTFEPESVDAVVTDPPYSLAFMGRAWDRHDDEDAAFGYYLSGLIDGEGSFRVGAQDRRCEFSIKLRADDEWILRRMAAFVGHGRLNDEPARDGSAPLVRLTIDTKVGVAAVCALLLRYPLRAKKLRDFLTWAEAVDEWLAMERGNRWHGPADRARLHELGERIRSGRVYSEIAWSGNGYQDWTRQWAAEAYRVLKPGGHLLSFSSTRTYHRMASGIEDAGFELRDTIAWLFGSGFPKSRDVAKALGVVYCPTGVACSGCCYCENARVEAERWQGWGTALKPAFEPIAVARKPLSGTVAQTVREHGTGALNIDGCRIPGEKGDGNWTGRDVSGSGSFIQNQAEDYGERGNMELGRWPANVCMDEEAGAILDGQTGELTSGEPGGSIVGADRQRNTYGRYGGGIPLTGYGDTGGASRFFYSAKTSRAERNAGLDGFEAKPLNWSSGDANPGSFQAEGTDRSARNHHPTVKPVALMRWLCRLVTPAGGLILDPFLGSGTTGIAAALEGFQFAGCERDPDYMAIARARIAFWTEHGEDGLRICAERDAAERERAVRADAGQLDLFGIA